MVATATASDEPAADLVLDLLALRGEAADGLAANGADIVCSDLSALIERSPS